jgi:hypothetical protein
MLKALRKELKQIAPKIRVDEEQLKAILENEVLKREVVDSEEAKHARAAFAKAARNAARAKEAPNSAPSSVPAENSPIHVVASQAT